MIPRYKFKYMCHNDFECGTLNGSPNEITPLYNLYGALECCEMEMQYLNNTQDFDRMEYYAEIYLRIKRIIRELEE